jgi:cytochrome c oxidase assembly protein subunit 11
VIARTVQVRFDANTDPNLAWRFEPLEREVKMRLGEEKLVHFRATNLSQRPIVGTATYNVTPERTAGWFNKVQCFCFTEQLLQPGQSVDMPVVFFVDAEMAKDRRYDDIRTITLSYTFYEAKTERAKTLLGGMSAGGTEKGAEPWPTRTADRSIHTISSIPARGRRSARSAPSCWRWARHSACIPTCWARASRASSTRSTGGSSRPAS